MYVVCTAFLLNSADLGNWVLGSGWRDKRFDREETFLEKWRFSLNLNKKLKFERKRRRGFVKRVLEPIWRSCPWTKRFSGPGMERAALDKPRACLQAPGRAEVLRDHWRLPSQRPSWAALRYSAAHMFHQHLVGTWLSASSTLAQQEGYCLAKFVSVFLYMRFHNLMKNATVP